MSPDPITPVGAAAAAAAANVVGAAAGRSTVAPGPGFAALLDAQQRPAESLPTVTFGEMLGGGFAEAPARVSRDAKMLGGGFAEAPARVSRDAKMVGLSAEVPVVPASVATAAATAVTAPGADARSGGTLTWPVQGRVTSEFGPRVHPITGVRRPHQGIDIAASTGTPIAAAAAGRVTFAGTQSGYGNIVIVDHGNGVETRYAHQDTIAVTAGQRIDAGQQLGTVGSTGLSTGPHLHFEVRRQGEAVNPRKFLG